MNRLYQILPKDFANWCRYYDLNAIAFEDFGLPTTVRKTDRPWIWSRSLSAPLALCAAGLVLLVALLLPTASFAYGGYLGPVSSGTFSSSQTHTFEVSNTTASWPGSIKGTDYDVPTKGRGYWVYACRAAADRGYPNGWLNNSFTVATSGGREVYEPYNEGASLGAFENPADLGRWVGNWDSGDPSAGCNSPTGPGIWGRHVAGPKPTLATVGGFGGKNFGSGPIWDAALDPKLSLNISSATIDSTHKTYMTAGGTDQGQLLVPHAGLRYETKSGAGDDFNNCYGNGVWRDAPGGNAGASVSVGAAWWSKYSGRALFSSDPTSLNQLPNAICQLTGSRNYTFPSDTNRLMLLLGCNKPSSAPSNYCRGDGSDRGGYHDQTTPLNWYPWMCPGFTPPSPLNYRLLSEPNWGYEFLWLNSTDPDPLNWTCGGRGWVNSNATRSNAQNNDNWKTSIRSAQIYVSDPKDPEIVDFSQVDPAEDVEVNEPEQFTWRAGDDAGLRKVEFWVGGSATTPPADTRDGLVQSIFPRGDVNPCYDTSSTTCDKVSNYQVHDFSRYCDHTFMLPCPGSDKGWDRLVALNGRYPAQNDYISRNVFPFDPRHSFYYDVDTLAGNTDGSPRPYQAHLRVTDAGGNTSTQSISFSVDPVCLNECEPLDKECLQTVIDVASKATIGPSSSDAASLAGGPAGAPITPAADPNDRDCEDKATPDEDPNVTDEPDPVSTPTTTTNQQCDYEDGKGYVDAAGNICLFTYTLEENSDPTRRPLDSSDCEVREQVIGKYGAKDPISNPQTNQVVAVTVHLNTFLKDGGSLGEQSSRTSADLPTRNNPRYRKALGCEG